MKQNLLLIKPCAFKAKLVAHILHRFEERFQVMMMKTVHMDRSLCAEHYLDHVDEPYYLGLVNHMTSGPTLAIMLKGDDDLIKDCRKMVTRIRENFRTINPQNLIHSSDSDHSAYRELKIWFPLVKSCELG